MSIGELNIAEVLYPTGQVKYRYSRQLSPDQSKWIRHGKFIAYHENGTIASDGNYENGVEQGRWRDYHPNGQIASDGCYESGVEVGEWNYWDPDGHRE